MEHIHLLVSTFDTSNVAVAHNLRSCSRPPSETRTKTKTKTSKKWSWSVSRPRPGLETHIPVLSIFDTSLSSLMMWNVQFIKQQFCMKEWDIVRGGVKTLTPTTYFHGGQDPKLQDLRPSMRENAVSLFQRGARSPTISPKCNHFHVSHNYVSPCEFSQIPVMHIQVASSLIQVYQFSNFSVYFRVRFLSSSACNFH